MKVSDKNQFISMYENERLNHKDIAKYFDMHWSSVYRLARKWKLYRNIFCELCGIQIPFVVNQRQYCSFCGKIIDNIRFKDWKYKNRELYNKYSKLWRLKNPNYFKTWSKNNRNRFINYQKKWKLNNPEYKKPKKYKSMGTSGIGGKAYRNKNKNIDFYKERNIVYNEKKRIFSKGNGNFFYKNKSSSQLEDMQNCEVFKYVYPE